MSAEYIILHKHTLKILCKSKHFPRRYKRKREWVFFSEHSALQHQHLMPVVTVIQHRRFCIVTESRVAIVAGFILVVLASVTTEVSHFRFRSAGRWIFTNVVAAPRGFVTVLTKTYQRTEYSKL